MKQQTTLPFNDRVADRIQALLSRCDQLRRTRDLNRPVVFDERGEQHARSIAAADGSTPQAQPTPVPPGSHANLGLPEEPRDAKPLTRYFTPEAQRRAETSARKDCEMDWKEIAERESAQLQRERDADWDTACERMVDELKAEATEPPKTWEEICEREAAKPGTGRTGSL